MTTEEKTITVIRAAEGKWLRRKSDGTVCGETVYLGNNYYDAGLPVSAEADTADAFEEIDKPEEGQEAASFSDKDRLLRMAEIVDREKTRVNGYELTAKEALETKRWFPVWGEDIVDGTSMTKGFRFQYTADGETDSVLYEVIQDHTAQMQYAPSTATAALYNAVNVEAEGTADDPIAYVPPMQIYNGKYYTQSGVTYLCTRDSGTALSHDLSALVGLYVSVVE